MSKWVTSWGLPVSYISEGMGNLFDDTTFRHVFYNNLKGKKVRVRFSNEYGNEDVKLEAVSIAEHKGKGPAVIADTLKEITLKEKGNIIKAGGELVTDEIDFELTPGKKYVISFYIKEVTRLVTGYNMFFGDIYSPAWLSRGNNTYSETFVTQNKLELQNCAFICGVDVLSDDSSKAIIAFGDSITARPWPDLLALRINGDGITNTSVVRKAVGGNRVLRDYRDNLTLRRRGNAAVERFETAIRQVNGVDKVIMLEGINDIFHPHPESAACSLDELPTAEQLIEGYKKCCDLTRKYEAEFYLCTIMPSRRLAEQGFGKEEMRNEINEWIRTNDYIDGYIDFDKLTADKDNPSAMAKEYDSGDTLHPNLDGSAALCNAVPKELYS